MRPKNLWPRIAIAVVVAVGLNIVWGVFCGWLSTVWQWNFAHLGQTWERLLVDETGQPLISVTRSGPVYQGWYRTLHGERLPEDVQPVQLTPAPLSNEVPRKRWYNPPLSWRWRVLSATDARNQNSSTWYLIQEPGADHLLYLAGYDDLSRLPIGFLGRNGFHPSKPAPNDRFDVGYGALVSEGRRVVGKTLGNYARSYYADDSKAPPWRLYLIDSDQLMEVDLRAKSSRTITAVPGAISMGIVAQTEPSPPADEDQPAAARPAKNTTGIPQRSSGRIAVRYADRVALVDPSNGESVHFGLPDELKHSRELAVYSLAGREIFAMPGSPYSSLRRRTTLYRIGREGKVVEATPLELAGSLPDSDAEKALKGVTLAPSPLAWAVIGLAAGPVGELQEGRAANYPEAVQVFARTYWPAYVIALIAGVASALIVMRLQRRYYRDHTRPWSIATLLLGPPMLLAYLAELRRPAIAGCPNCGRAVPHIRDACPACAKPFPKPALTGIEVFA